MLPRYETNQELWIRPTPWIRLRELQQLIEREELNRTPRLGDRTPGQPKGYRIGWEITLWLLDSRGNQQLKRRVAVTDLTVRRLHELTAAELAGCGPAYRTWKDVQRALSLFEMRPVRTNEPVTIVAFTYHPPGAPS